MKKSVSLFLFLIPITLFAHHLNGGYISLKWLASNKYELSVKLVREFGYGYGADQKITIGIFQKGTDSLKQQILLDFNRLTSDTLALPGNCKTADPRHILENYKKEISFDTSIMNHLNTYYLSYQRCCRPSGIANIALSGDMGMCLYAEIPAPGFIKNSSPTLAKFPYLAAVLNKPFMYSLACEDSDQDYLRYSLVTPLKGGFTRDNPSSNSAQAGPYPEAPYNPNYSLANVLGVAPQNRLKIDSITGLLSAVPEREGKYSIGVLVEEYRAGVKIGETRLDLVMFVFRNWNRDLTLSVVDELGSAITDDTLFVSPADSLFLGAYANVFGDSVFITFDFPQESLDTFAFKPTYSPKVGNWRRVNSNFYWKGNCAFNRSEAPMLLTVTSSDNGCLSPNTLSKTYYIKTRDELKIKGPTQVCAGENAVRFSMPESLLSNTYTWLLPDWMKGDTTGHSIHSSSTLGNYWFKDRLLFMGDTNKFVTHRGNGVYTSILNLYGCKSDASNEIIINTLGLPSVTNSTNLHVFPNPFEAELHVALPPQWQMAEYALTNTLGQTVQKGIFVPNQKIQTALLLPGIYFLTIQNIDVQYQIKVIKE